MIVCHCHRLSDQQIRRAFRESGGDPGQLTLRCAVGTGCGGCLPAVRAILIEEREAALRDARAEVTLAVSDS